LKKSIDFISDLKKNIDFISDFKKSIGFNSVTTSYCLWHILLNRCF